MSQVRHARDYKPAPNVSCHENANVTCQENEKRILTRKRKRVMPGKRTKQPCSTHAPRGGPSAYLARPYRTQGTKALRLKRLGHADVKSLSPVRSRRRGRQRRRRCLSSTLPFPIYILSPDMVRKACSWALITTLPHNQSHNCIYCRQKIR